MEQDRAARDVAPAEVWDEARDRAEAEWVDPSPQDQAEIVYAQNVEQRHLTSLDSRVIKEAALNVVQE
jgi:hypothetical protein